MFSDISHALCMFLFLFAVQLHKIRFYKYIVFVFKCNLCKDKFAILDDTPYRIVLLSDDVKTHTYLYI